MKKIISNSVPIMIKERFFDTYKSASDFANIPLFNQCMKIIGNTIGLKELISENDKGIPPVQILLRLLEEYGVQPEELSDYDSICIGELMAFVFKHVLGYKRQKDNVPIKDSFGIKTAALYFDSQELEIL